MLYTQMSASRSETLGIQPLLYLEVCHIGMERRRLLALLKRRNAQACDESGDRFDRGVSAPADENNFSLDSEDQANGRETALGVTLRHRLRCSVEELGPLGPDRFLP